MFLSRAQHRSVWPRLALLAGVAAVAAWRVGREDKQASATPHPARDFVASRPSPAGGEGWRAPLSPCGRGPTRAERPERGEGSGNLGDCAPATSTLRRAPFPGPYAATLIRVVDGDTFEGRVRVWFGEEVATLVRVRGIDAPELHARCDAERHGAEAARDALARLLTGREIELSGVGPDKYFGRVVADVWVADEDGARDVAASLREAGLARVYDGHARASWCDPPALADARPIVAQNPHLP